MAPKMRPLLLQNTRNTVASGAFGRKRVERSVASTRSEGSVSWGQRLARSVMGLSPLPREVCGDESVSARVPHLYVNCKPYVNQPLWYFDPRIRKKKGHLNQEAQHLQTREHGSRSPSQRLQILPGRKPSPPHTLQTALGPSMTRDLRPQTPPYVRVHERLGRSPVRGLPKHQTASAVPDQHHESGLGEYRYVPIGVSKSRGTQDRRSAFSAKFGFFGQ